MAKVVNGGNKKGKVGSSIFYTIKNSNNKVTQGERIYQPNVTNPQSESQRAQRMKMTPASNFYRALSGILDHSWEGVKYGAMSRQYFMKLAMSANQTIFPYVNKGTTFVVPGPYPISRGSLPSIGFSMKGSAIFINVESTVGEDGSVGFWSKKIIANNPFLRNGDQLTFIALYDLEDREQRTYSPVVTRFLLDSESTERIVDVLGEFWNVESDEGSMIVGYEGFRETATIAGACVVVSRKNESGGQVWQRSTEVMAVTDAVLNEWMSPNAYAGALDSYKRSESVSDSDFYLNDAETESEVGGGSSYSFTNQQAAFTLGTATENITSVIAQNENGAQATCAEYGFYEEETPDNKNAWIQPYYIRGRQLVAADRVNLTAPADSSLTARFDGEPITVYNPRQFVARFNEISLG